MRVKGYGYTCIRKARAVVELTYRQVEAALAGHFRVHPDRLSTFRSRIKQLQRLQFPPGVNVGRGARAEYNAESLFQLVLAFELISCGQPALTACKLVERHWQQFAAGFALAALQERKWGTERQPHVIAVLWIEALHEIQFSRSTWVAIEPSSVEVRDEEAGVQELRDYHFDRHNTRLIISVGKILRSVLEIATKHAGALDASAFDDEFHGWLPKGAVSWIRFAIEYPDRSNLEMRQSLQRVYGNDPDSLTPEGEAEAEAFRAAGFSYIPF